MTFISKDQTCKEGTYQCDACEVAGIGTQCWNCGTRKVRHNSFPVIGPCGSWSLEEDSGVRVCP